MMVGMVMMVGMMVGMVARGPDSMVPPTPPRCPRQPGDDLDEAALVAAGVLYGPEHRTLNVALVCEVLAYMRSEETLVLAMASPRSSQHPHIAALLHELDLLAETRAVLVAPPPPLSRGGVSLLLSHEVAEIVLPSNFDGPFWPVCCAFSAPTHPVLSVCRNLLVRRCRLGSDWCLESDVGPKLTNLGHQGAGHDCMEREFDLGKFGTDPTSAASRRLLGEITAVFETCGMVVLRNAFPSAEVEGFVADYSNYIRGVKSGRVSSDGGTTNGEPFYAFKLDPKRWDVLMPRELARPGMLLSPVVNMFFKQTRVLGENFVVHSLGSVLGLPGAPPMAWHRDAPVLFDDLFARTQGKVHSSDLPPHSVTMIMPLLEMSHDHGPTEFCMGSKHAETYQEMKMAGTLDEMDLSQEFGPRGARELREHADYWKCPERFRRAPVTAPGDAILFDFRTKHRVLPNLSNQTRALLYWGFARQWYKDQNYADDQDGTKLLVPRDKMRGVAVDRRIRRRAAELIKRAAKSRSGSRPWLERGDPRDGYAYQRTDGPPGAQEVALVNELLRSARFAVPREVGCDGLVTDAACGAFAEAEAAMPRDVRDMTVVLEHSPAREATFRWYEDLDGDGVLSRRDFQVPGGIEAGDMDEAELNHLTMVADADANSEVSWDEMAAYDRWTFNNPEERHAEFPPFLANLERMRGDTPHHPEL